MVVLLLAAVMYLATSPGGIGPLQRPACLRVLDWLAVAAMTCSDGGLATAWLRYS